MGWRPSIESRVRSLTRATIFFLFPVSFHLRALSWVRGIIFGPFFFRATMNSLPNDGNTKIQDGASRAVSEKCPGWVSRAVSDDFPKGFPTTFRGVSEGFPSVSRGLPREFWVTFGFFPSGSRKGYRRHYFGSEVSSNFYRVRVRGVL